MIPEAVKGLGCYHSFSVSQHFIIEDWLDKSQYQLGVDTDPDEEDIKDVVLGYDIYLHYHIVFKDNNGEADGKQYLLHEIRWDVHNSDKEALVKGGYQVEVYDKYGKKLIWEVVNDHVVEEGVDNDELDLQGFILIYLIGGSR